MICHIPSRSAHLWTPSGLLYCSLTHCRSHLYTFKCHIPIHVVGREPDRCSRMNKKKHLRTCFYISNALLRATGPMSLQVAQSCHHCSMGPWEKLDVEWNYPITIEQRKKPGTRTSECHQAKESLPQGPLQSQEPESSIVRPASYSIWMKSISLLWFWFGDHNRQCSGLTPGSGLRNYSQQYSRDPRKYQIQTQVCHM